MIDAQIKMIESQILTCGQSTNVGVEFYKQMLHQTFEFETSDVELTDRSSLIFDHLFHKVDDGRLQHVIACLKADILTRQSIILFKGNDQFPSRYYPPCIVFYQFLYDGSRLNIAVYARSINVSTEFLDDISVAKQFLLCVCSALGKLERAGKIVFHVGSIHAKVI
jgi:thymidylate synthase